VGKNDKNGKRSPGKAPRPPSEAYLALVRRHPLRPLGSEGDLDAALVFIDELFARRSLSAEEDDYLAVLALLVEEYEDEHYPMLPVSGGRMLGFFLEQQDKTLRQVARDTGIAPSTLSAVVHGKRELTRGHIEKLAPYFGVSPEVFLP
jgi:HTH-type transcriptional regulator/antitoxin HigA